MCLRRLIALGMIAGLLTPAAAKSFAVLPWVSLEADEAYWRLARIGPTRALVLLGPSVDDSTTVLAYHAETFQGPNEDYFQRAVATLQRHYGQVALADEGQLWTASLGPLDYRVWAYRADSQLRFQIMYLFRTETSLHRFEGLGSMAGYENLRGQMDAIVSGAQIDPERR